ncbi:DNA alkylation repair protein [Methanolobus sp. ZRKC2]|uniref:DNA alkylation repair protein n=1 Tax=Methanolobus sp. ZRKC2 TaxID=3125783 RepID=UPI0032564187
MDDTTGTKYHKILERLESLSDSNAIEGMARFGITPGKAFGVSIPELRRLAKETGKDHELALKLWENDSRETRILASMTDRPEMVTEVQIEEWVTDFDYWEICDQCCMNLFEKTPFAYTKAAEWSSREEEFVKRSGFVLMARLAVSDKKADNSAFEQFFPLIVRESCDSRNYVKKAINWALRQIGKRNLYLHSRALETADEILLVDCTPARWIARDAIRELTGEKVRKKLLSKK